MRLASTPRVWSALADQARRQARVAALLAFVFLGVGGATLAAGCAGQHVGSPPAAPSMANPDGAIPNDLDWVVRVDLARMQGALGPDLMRQLRQQADAGAGSERASPQADSLSQALRLADTVWIAFRPAERFELTDNVVVMRGKFAEFAPSGAERWDPAQDLGADWRRRDQRGQLERRAPRRMYLRGNDLLVFVSDAELHSVARQLERGEGDPRVSPPERGAIAFAGRVHLGTPLMDRPWVSRYPQLARLLKHALNVAGFVDLEAGEARLELDVEYTDEAVAKDTLERTKLVLSAMRQLDPPLSTLSRTAKLSQIGAHLVLRWRLPIEALQAFMPEAEVATPSPAPAPPL